MLLGYLYVFITILAGLTKGFCGKKTSDYTKEFKDAAFINAVRMVLCFIIGFIVMIISGNLNDLILSPTNFLIAALSGISTAVFVVTWLITVKSASYMLVDVVLTVSVLIPVVFSAIFFNESIHYFQIIGFALLVVSVIIMASYNNSIKTDKLNSKSIVILVICGLSQGLSLFSQKIYTNVNINPSVSSFNFYTYVFSAIILIAFYLITVFTQKRKADASNLNNDDIGDNTIKTNPFKTLKKIFIYVAIMACCLYVYSYFSTLASSALPATLQYPLTQGLNLTLSLLMSAIFFKEKITTKSVVSIALTFASLIMINLLPSII